MRHALFIAIRPCLSILFVACTLSCGPKLVKTEFRPLLVDAQGRPSLGYLEHRGEMHDLRTSSWSDYDKGERRRTLAGYSPPPMLADNGNLTFLGVVTSSIVDEQVHMIDLFPEFPMSGYEDTEEEQCVEFSAIGVPTADGIPLIFPE